jgi:transposase
MFVRVKPSGKYQYLQVVQNYREGPKVKQKVIGTLGRMDQLLQSGTLDNLAQSLLRFSKRLKVVEAHQAGDIQAKAVLSIGPGLVFDRLWQRLGFAGIIVQLLEGRKFSFSVERAIFLTVLHRLFGSGSDREADTWKEDYRLEGVEGLQLHHVYRAMAWLGEELAEQEQEGASAFTPRCTKDVLEEKLFERNKDLFSSLSLVFFDTTSLYFEGEGGESLGRRGNSKDHRPDLKQMVVGAVLDGEGHPICCELWPGNTTDVQTLIPIVERLRRRFGIGSVCIVAPPVFYILGVRMRKLKEVREEVLKDGGEYLEVFPERQGSKDASPLKVKEVWVEDRRYIECYNAEQARKDAASRRAILEALEEKLKRGDKVLIGNKGYRRYLKTPERGSHFTIDEEKAKQEQRFDGLWVLRTNTELPAQEVALKYKQLWMVEHVFRSVKSMLRTRPVYHKYDATIRGHVFCSFLALILVKELQSQLEARGLKLEWKDVLRDIDKLQEIEVESGTQRFFLRTELRGNCVDILRAVGVRIPSAVRQ